MYRKPVGQKCINLFAFHIKITKINSFASIFSCFKIILVSLFSLYSMIQKSCSVLNIVANLITSDNDDFASWKKKHSLRELYINAHSKTTINIYHILIPNVFSSSESFEVCSNKVRRRQKCENHSWKSFGSSIVSNNVFHCEI